MFDEIVRMRAAGTAVLLVEQNAPRALEIADIGCVLDLGRVHLSRPAAELVADPWLAQLYLGGRPAGSAGTITDEAPARPASRGVRGAGRSPSRR